MGHALERGKPRPGPHRPESVPGLPVVQRSAHVLARIRAGAGTGAGARPVLFGEPGLLPRPGVAATAPRSVARFRDSVRAMYAAQVRWRLITTFNEWGEGTAVEASTSWGNAYMDVLASAAPPPPKPPAPPPRPRQQRLGVASVAIAAGSRSALVTTRIGTGATPRDTGAGRVGQHRRYGHHTAWRVVRRIVGLRRLRFRIGPLPARGRTHLRVVVRSGSVTAAHLRRSPGSTQPAVRRGRARGPQASALNSPCASPRLRSRPGAAWRSSPPMGTGGSRQQGAGRVDEALATATVRPGES